MRTADNERDIRAMDRAMEAFLRHLPTYDVKPNQRQVDQLRTYVSELLRWNEKINLTAAEGPGEVLLRHVLDSLIPLAHLSGINRLLDVGPGGGFPGIPIKIFRPEVFVVLVEARRKKAAFNQHVVGSLGLTDIEVIWGRLGEEEVNRRLADTPVDAIITRATFSGAKILKLGLGVLRPGGKILLMKGAVDERQIGELTQEASRQRLELFLVAPYRLPGSRQKRTLILFRRT